jgi:4'-phosphopantetheinyl transferase
MPAWLIRSLTDVPPGDAWLSARERRAALGLRVARRRRDWRLGRFTAKAAAGAFLSVAPERIEIIAAADGAPEAWIDGELAPLSVSISHRAGRALAVVASAPGVIGCDLERIEPRSGAFVRDWLAPAEHGLLAAHAATDRDLLANLVWTAKEAAAKVRREGLRLDVRGAVVAPAGVGGADDSWRELSVTWRDQGEPTAGWWRTDPGWVMTIAGDPAPERPVRAVELTPARPTPE